MRFRKKYKHNQSKDIISEIIDSQKEKIANYLLLMNSHCNKTELRDQTKLSSTNSQLFNESLNQMINQPVHTSEEQYMLRRSSNKTYFIER